MKSKLNLIYEESYKGAWHDEVKVVINFGSKMIWFIYFVAFLGSFSSQILVIILILK